MNVSSRELMPIVCMALERGQRVRLTLNGSSMLPFIIDGDVVELEPMRSMPMLGDILFVRCACIGREVVHRVVELKGDTFFLRGDMQARCKVPFTEKNIIGKVVALHRNGHRRFIDSGFWRLAGLLWLRTSPLGFFLLRGTLFARRLGRGAQRRAQRIWQQT